MAGQLTHGHRFDVAIVGLGIMGAAAASALARNGAAVVGLDQFTPPHTNGSSHGETRMVRLAYAEGDAYVPFMRRAMELWADLNIRSQQIIFRRTGILYAAPAVNRLIDGVVQSAKAYDLDVFDGRTLDIVASDRVVHIPDDWTCIFESDAGYALAEQSQIAFLEEARRWQADLRVNTKVLAIEDAGPYRTIHTDRGDITADSVIVTAGPWTASLLPAFQQVLSLERRVLNWYADPGDLYTTQTGFIPLVTEELSGDWFYCFPNDNGSGVKVGVHGGNDPVTSPALVDRTIHDRDTAAMDTFARTRLVKTGPRRQSATCLYTMTPDEAFIIDQHPSLKGVFVAAGMSGHGFKFAPAIGEALSDMALRRPLQVDLAMFSARRFAD